MENDNFDSGVCKFIEGIFLVREMIKFLEVGCDSSPTPWFPIKV